ncbi:tudor domain-containing protein 7B isoform X1 [Alosa sapidissima]|uniref:tudor domain-containing protein 7B isoform X1 n=2 Tax=Alosa sapidissima TaxID=34773 RepID=UPI001C092656|nr:tudor domain-containing protein 7B isoform X1 [Alosa sapidissima]
MADLEPVKRMLRALLQSSKGGVTLGRLQAEYKELTGELIPHKQLGHATLDALLLTMPSVVRMERNRNGEMVCYATVGSETAHIAKLVARQRTAKKTGRPQLVNCQMRVKPAAPLVLNAKPRTSLRQPDHRGRLGRGGGRPGGVADSRQGHVRDGQADGRGNAGQNKAQNTPARKASSASDRPDKRMTLPSRFQKEVHAHLSRNPQQSNAPANLNESSPQAKPKTGLSGSYNPQQVQGRLKEILNKYSNGLWVSKLPQLYRELYKQELPGEALKDLEQWTHVCTLEKPCSTNPAELLLYPAKDPSSSGVPSTPTPPRGDRHSPGPQKLPPPRTPTPSTPSTPASPPSPAPSGPGTPPPSLTPELRRNLGELLLRYSSGLWAHALPKLYQDTYKSALPEHVLQNLALLADFCTVDYPMPDNPKRAILYVRAAEDENCNRARPEAETESEAGKRPSCQAQVPALQIPREEYPSVLVVEAACTNSVVLRYIGEGYSQAQEKLEDEMREFYGQDNTRKALTNPVSGQLAAVRAEEEEEILRAQVCEVMADKVKVYYVDHGFSEVISKTKLLELHEKFFKLPFQATKCKLAGLEQFSQEASVLKKFDSMASGKILLAEILERQETPLMVLYDTSQDDDVNINAACMKALQDKSLESPLQVNSAYMNVSVSSVCSDGTIYCQLPSRGLAKLTEVLGKTEAYFHSQVTSEFLVSRPFCGKGCLARYKGKWSRVEITNLHGSRVLDILFIDLGVQASVEVIELREFPPPHLCDLIAIPPQVVKCCLADLAVSVGSWTPDAVQWLRDTVLHCSDCSIKIAKQEESKRLVHVHLFTSKNFHDMSRSVNRQLADSDLWKHQKDVFLSSHAPSLKTTPTTVPGHTHRSGSPTSTNGTRAPQLRRAHSLPGTRGTPPTTPQHTATPAPQGRLQMPPLLELPPAGQNLDVYVSVACHPGHFVLQSWQDMYKLVVLMGEMILHYNKTDDKPVAVEKNQVYAAKVENNWHRVLVKGILTNGLVSVYELDYGKHELVSCTQLRPLIQEFRQLPFQGITAQLAGVKPRQWSEEASIVFRNHVEKKPLVAQLEAVQEAPNAWDRKVTVYLVDTSQEEHDVWVHDIMAEFADELTKAA